MLKFESIFHENRNYYISKIYDGIERPKEFKEYGKIHLKLIKEMIELFKSELEKRKPLRTFSIIEFTYNELQYPINKLEAYFNGNKTINKKTALIFTSFIGCQIEKLKSMAKKIDDNGIC
ncbi:hypothetical protein SCACP_25490 [Sporomusa carbonis]|uniref:hypothetical protein n=1 Tax=Sporomusa carbonis TaxID=3076075 RepID=UPI003A633ACC